MTRQDQKSYPTASIISRLYPNARLVPFTPRRIAGFIPPIIVTTIILLAYITVVPATLIPIISSHLFIASTLLIIFHILFLSTLFNYLLLVFLDPGSPPECFSHPPPPAPFSLSHLLHERSYHGHLRYCQICRAYKPDRTHHCSVCQRCILKMDHHCVFVNNCISFYNHKFFISFVTYAFLGCLFVSIVSLPTFSTIISLTAPSKRHAAAKANTHVFQAIQKAVTDMPNALRTLAMIGYITTTAFTFALLIFVTLHFYLVAKGRTTIEMYDIVNPVRRQHVQEYDLGLKKNVHSVCGTSPLCWLLPTRAFIEGDGVEWERRDLDEEEGPLAV